MPLRLSLKLQRIGRTGRQREGHVHILLSEDREECNWDKANNSYRDVQRFIIEAKKLELYVDVERLIPGDIKPECIDQMMVIEEYVREDPALHKRGGPKSAKQAGNIDVMQNIHADASPTFVGVNLDDLSQKGISKKRKKTANKEFDDSDDEEMHTSSSPQIQAKKKMRRTVTTAATSNFSRNYQDSGDE